MKYNRDKFIERLIDDKADTVDQWARDDWHSFRQYITEAENLEKLDDDMIKDLYLEAFDDEVED